jgi:hypothetical protein
MLPMSRTRNALGGSARAALFILLGAMQCSLLGACFGLKQTPGGDAGAEAASEYEAGSEESSAPDAGCMPNGQATDFYVDPSANAAPCSFPTITAAVSAAQSSIMTPRTIHVPAGTFTTPGETFPIDLRGGISLVGAGQGATTVIGAGRTTFIPAQNTRTWLSRAATVQATFLVGDPEKASTISGLSLQPPAGRAIDGLEAIVCERGNASQQPPAPNTTVDHVRIEGFEVGVRVTTLGGGSVPSRPGPNSGCNLQLTLSTLKNGYFGVVADGVGIGTVDVQPVSFDLENNVFLNMDIGGSQFLAMNGAGLATCNAVAGPVIKNNQFLQEPQKFTDWGIWAVTNTVYELSGFDIEGNSFGPLTNGGIWLWGTVNVKRLVNNKFHDISMEPAANLGWLAAALLMNADVANGPGPFPVVSYARQNEFTGNDIGVDFRSLFTQLPSNGASLTFDFGTASDKGQNTFSCNSAPASLQTFGAGADVIMEFRTPEPVVTVPFEGNFWDHHPPTVGTSSWVPPSTPVGTDVWLAADAGVLMGGNIDSDGATAVTPGPCPSGRVAGP